LKNEKLFIFERYYSFKGSKSLRGLSEGLKQEKEPYKELQRASEWTWRAHCPPGYIFL